jgi:hypothetical protein
MQHPHRIGPVGWVLAFLSWPAESRAHGFAVRYDLPIPLEYFLAGAGATVALTFLLLAVFGREIPARAGRPPARLLSRPLGRLLSNPWVAGFLRGASVALYLLVVAAALFGDENPYRNISTTFVWVIWWVGMLFVNTFVGDIWALVNPWGAIFAGAEGVVRLARPGARLSLERPYPGRLGLWPAVFLFLVFAWLELVSGEGEDPRKLALFIIGYSVVTWTGMVVFGRLVWLARGEAFAVVFSTFARFAPAAFRAESRGSGAYCAHGVETTEEDCTGCAACFETADPAGRAIALRLPGTGLLTRRPVPVSLAALVLVLLGTVTFDGFFATPAWTAIYGYLNELAGRAPSMTGALRFSLVATPLFLLFPVAIAAVFLFCCRLTAAIAGGVATAEVARHFALTLLPIAIAYHLAHYLAYLLLGGQYIIPAVSDPFGYGWDLFGTASFRPDIGLVGARFAWYTSVIAIVTGHVIAVCLAHRTAVRLFQDRKRMLASQLPVLSLMVAYTMLSLWIIAQPTVQ